jgi:hypothetical protein
MKHDIVDWRENQYRDSVSPFNPRAVVFEVLL